MKSHGTIRPAFSLLELLAAVTILAIVAAYVILRVGNFQTSARRNACFTNQGEIELQTKLWQRNHGSYPMTNLSNIGGDATYFPDGLPTCPVDGSAYTIDTTTGLVVGHTH
jgi:prepilin-type N-terminal cleavage/methylation domain-containing protein